ncbi:hypothetical protein HMPREF0262_02565 [Clostridium sp. ATCC 29733]|nr:hypothetical protein HMPREF0262_02565 [Clostridium sp. ATCC 29733]
MSGGPVRPPQKRGARRARKPPLLWGKGRGKVNCPPAKKGPQKLFIARGQPRMLSFLQEGDGLCRIERAGRGIHCGERPRTETVCAGEEETGDGEQFLRSARQGRGQH